MGEEIIELDLNKPWILSDKNYMEEQENIYGKRKIRTKKNFITIVN